MKRRDFLRCGAAAAGAIISLDKFPHQLYASDQKKLATDVVTLGRTGIKVSRLAQGTGTSGVNHSSNQIRQMGDRGLADLLVKASTTGSTSGTSPISTAATRTRRRRSRR